MKENPRLVEFDRTRSHAVLETPHQMLRESQQNTHTFRLFTTLTRGRRLALLVGSTFPRFHARYQLPNPRTLSSNHSFDSISMPDRKEQQRILLPYRQSLLVEPRKCTLSRRPSRSRRNCERIAGGKWAFRRRDRVLMSRKACGDIKIPRRVQLGEVLFSHCRHFAVERGVHPAMERLQGLQFLVFALRGPNGVRFIHKKAGYSLENTLYFFLDELAANATHSVLAEATSAPAPRRMSNPLSCPPRLRTRGMDDGAAAIHPRVVVPEESEGRNHANRHAGEASGEKGMNESTLCELFEAYCSEMEKRKARLEGWTGGLMSRFDEIQAATHSFHQDAEELTTHFVEMLKQRGVNTDMLDSLCTSLQLRVCSTKQSKR